LVYKMKSDMEIIYPSIFISFDLGNVHKDFENQLRRLKTFSEQNNKWHVGPDKEGNWHSLFTYLSMRCLNSNDHVAEINSWWISKMEEAKEILDQFTACF
jgi:hypothetical protein